MRRKPGLGLARDGSVGKAGWGYVRSFALVFVLELSFWHLHATPRCFSLGRNEVKRDDGCGARLMSHLPTPKHAIMRVSPNERRHHHSNAEPQGQLLRQTLDADRHVGASLRDERRVRLLCVQVDERGVAAHVST